MVTFFITEQTIPVICITIAYCYRRIRHHRFVDCQVQNHCTITTSNARHEYCSILCRLGICLACFKPYIYRLTWTSIVWTANRSIYHSNNFWSYCEIQCNNNTIAASDGTLQSILIDIRLRVDLIIHSPLVCFTMTYCHLLWCCFYDFSNREYMLSLKNIITCIFNHQGHCMGSSTTRYGCRNPSYLRNIRDGIIIIYVIIVLDRCSIYIWHHARC